MHSSSFSLEALNVQEEHGLSPILPDGKIGGNGAVTMHLSSGDVMLVSKSGKSPGEMDISTDICIVTNFNTAEWKADYFSEIESVKPTSDTPMHYAILKFRKTHSLEKFPRAAIHGHGLATEKEANQFQIPCSTEETLFSTREDTQALIDLMQLFPYPEHQLFIRKNHGYYIAGDSIADCVNIMQERIIKKL